MATSDWRLEGEWIKNCSCAFGCPCDFNALPTQGFCKGILGMRITKGHFEGTRLDVGDDHSHALGEERLAADGEEVGVGGPALPQLRQVVERTIEQRLGKVYKAAIDLYTAPPHRPGVKRR